MPEGTIKKLVSDEGFGFIKCQQGELFFHQSAVSGVAFEDLYEGQQVTYMEGRGPKGPRAESVSVA
jgi:CspA family cold shock protein